MASTVWRGFLTFGLVSLPIRLFRGARPERISLRQIARPSSFKTQHRVDEPSAPDAADKSIKESWLPAHQNFTAPGAEPMDEPKNISKGFEVRKNEFVEINREELKQLRSKTSGEMVINEFVALNEIDPLFLESSYYVVPEEIGEKAYALLFLALQQANLVALAEVAMHGREHVIALRPGRTGLLAHTLYYLNEVHADEEFVADPSLTGAEELQLATQLIETLRATFDAAKYTDTYRERLQSLIDGKIQSVEPHAVIATAKRQGVVDISEALKKSLRILKKPAASQSAKPEKSRRKSGRSSAQGA